ncbi:NAD-dependent epimerase/dehydratase family protein [Shewanella sp. TC10]|uniref:NAD-dependent epimerase/dehydratase family protein n=1 Tax=Shewanella sp. TC10 TaxID=1419739 RepID=UPI00129D484D|nr:NAD-dependent epimerase/dehydratase family protein [Shewanella sp. TC10]
MKTAFVTGAGGFIGRHLVRDLLEKGYKVTALMFAGEAAPIEWQGRVKQVEGDIRTLVSISEDIGDFDVLFHLAAVVSDWGSRQEHVDITVNGTKQAIELAVAQQAHFIVTTSVCAYADALGKGKLTEASPTGNASSNYEFCKQQQECVTLEAVSKQGLKATIIRPGNVFGVGSIPWVIIPLAMIRNGDPIMMGTGHWDAGLVHVKNLVHLMLLVEGSKHNKGDIFLGSDGFGVTWSQYWNQLAYAANAPTPKQIPNWLARMLAPILELIGYVTKQKQRPLITRQAYRLTGGANEFSTAKAQSLLGYQPLVSFDQAMAELAQHLQQKQNSYD